MSKMRIYSLETGKHVATVEGSWGNDREAVRAGVDAGYCTNDYGYTCADDLRENLDAEVIKINN